MTPLSFVNNIDGLENKTIEGLENKMKQNDNLPLHKPPL